MCRLYFCFAVTYYENRFLFVIINSVHEICISAVFNYVFIALTHVCYLLYILHGFLYYCRLQLPVFITLLVSIDFTFCYFVSAAFWLVCKLQFFTYIFAVLLHCSVITAKFPLCTAFRKHSSKPCGGLPISLVLYIK